MKLQQKEIYKNYFSKEKLYVEEKKEAISVMVYSKGFRSIWYLNKKATMNEFVKEFYVINLGKSKNIGPFPWLFGQVKAAAAKDPNNILNKALIKYFHRYGTSLVKSKSNV